MKSREVLPVPFTLFKVLFLFLSISLQCVKALNDHHRQSCSGSVGPVVRREQRRPLVRSEYGEISSIYMNDGTRGPYNIQFITLEPNSLFLPVLLYSDMVLFCHTGSGSLSWADADKGDMKRVDLQGGDIYRLRPGSIFYMQSNLDDIREKLKIYAIFATTVNDIQEPSMGVYSRVSDLVRGFDRKVLQQAFQVPEEVIDELMSTNNPEQIVHATQRERSNFWELETGFLRGLLGGGMTYNKKKHSPIKAYNIHEVEPDFENCNGWSMTVSKKNTHLLKGSNVGFFMVNLTQGSMMGPHWNPMGSEIGIVLQGRGVVHVVCSSIESSSFGSSSTAGKNSGWRNKRLKVNEGDTFVVQRFQPMAQLSFKDESFVFMGFSTSPRKNHPQFLAGKSSVLQVMDRQVLAMTFNVSNNTICRVLEQQAESVILGCPSCAEKEEMMMKVEESRHQREEEERKRHEREEEERRRREREEEEARRREEEARRHEREERRRREEEARRHEREERRKQEEEATRHEREVKERRRHERKREKEEKESEESEARREEEERQRRRKEEEERESHEEEERKAERREEERQKERKEEAHRRRHEEQERERHEGTERRRHEEEEEAARRRHEKESERGHDGREHEEERDWKHGGEETEEEVARRQEEERRRKRDGGGSKEREVYPEEEEEEEERRFYKIWKM